MTLTKQQVEAVGRLLYYFDPENEHHCKAFRQVLGPAIDETLRVYRGDPGKPPVSWKTRLYWDVEFKLTSPFGPRGFEDHKGVDFAAWGEPELFACTAGTVTRAGGNATNSGNCKVGDRGCGGGWGNFVEWQSDKGLIRYCHLAEGSIILKPGDKIAVGDRIGKQGNTGNSFGAHLHLEVLVDGMHIDPIGYLVTEQGVFL